MIVTQWFNPRKKQFPVHVGVYQRKWDGRITYSYWTGWGWSFTGYTIEQAIINRHDCSYQQCALWRGIVK